jgi:hypothetical protein
MNSLQYVNMYKWLILLSSSVSVVISYGLLSRGKSICIHCHVQIGSEAHECVLEIYRKLEMIAAMSSLIYFMAFCIGYPYTDFLCGQIVMW